MPDNQTIIQQPTPQPPSDDSWARALTVGLCCFFGGFILAIIFNSQPEFRVTGFVMVIVFAYVIKWARGSFMAHELSMAQTLQVSRKEELQLLKERAAAEQREIKLLKAAEKVSTQAVKAQKTYVFTSEDFDDAAQGLLLGPVKAARKANAKVTGQGLVETFLKGLR